MVFNGTPMGCIFDNIYQANHFYIRMLHCCVQPESAYVSTSNEDNMYVFLSLYIQFLLIFLLGRHESFLASHYGISTKNQRRDCTTERRNRLLRLLLNSFD